ncbi:MAG: OFA family MFS transporter [Bacteroidales bacterium]|jgi:MFS family permease|nr:OFA family MFS transporter [Bacteroidales bacterium]
MFKFLQKERTIAGPKFNRWLVPPAALAIHLSIGMAYGFSVFWLPLSQSIGITEPVSAPEGISFFARIFSTEYDWPISMLGWMFTLFFVFLGLSAAIWGGWLEKVGPRKVGFISALLWSGGLVISALGVIFHQIWMLWLGSGVLGGIGLGLGYISPVSTLVKWFPDKRGMATGMAIMGFGGGAMIGAPLAEKLMEFYKTSTSVGVWETFLTLAAIYFIYMIIGALAYRIPPIGWVPKGWKPKKKKNNTMITQNHVHVNKAWKTPQFWLLWSVLCLNVSAGIGVLGMASPLLQEVFGGKLLGLDKTFSGLNDNELSKIAIVGAGFAGLLSLFNIGGRFVWASLSDIIGRKTTYAIFFILGIALYALAPSLGLAGSVALFVIAFSINISMYGGGFATIPAYLADLFGTQMVGAIHGRLLTAWSTAGILGPVLVNYSREFQLSKGIPIQQAYNTTFYILAGLLVLGMIANFLVKPVNKKYFMSEEELAKLRLSAAKENEKNEQTIFEFDTIGSAKATWKLIFAWTAVGIPLLYGFYSSIYSSLPLFKI